MTPEQRTGAQNAISFIQGLLNEGQSDRHDRGSSSRRERGSASELLSPTSGTDVESEDSLMTRADHVLERLRRVRSGMRAEDRRSMVKGKKRSAEEMGTLFKKKGKNAKRNSTWTHRFVCLSRFDQSTIPTTAAEKDLLISAGLGEKKVVIDDADCDASKFKDILIAEFPKLIDGGGYQLFKCKPNSRELEPLSSAALKSPRNLQSLGGSSRTYIRPLQQDLDLSKSAFDGDDMTEICLTCGLSISIDDLQEHVDLCKQAFNEDKSLEVEQKSSLEEHVSTENDFSEGGLSSFVEEASWTDCENDVFDTDNAVIDVPSPSPPPFEDVTLIVDQEEFCSHNVVCSDLKEIIRGLQHRYDIQLLVPSEEQKLLLEFRRDHVLQDALRHARRKKFSPQKSLKVIFIGEEGEDTGGLRREFWRLFVVDVANQYCLGDNLKTFQQNVPALQLSEFKLIGQYIAMSIIQDGFGLPIFPLPIYQYLVCGDISSINVTDDDIPDPGLRLLVSSIRAANDDHELVGILEDEIMAGYLHETGYRKAVKLENRDEIVQVMANYHTLLKVKAQIDQFLDGLRCLLIDEEIQRYPQLMQPLFVQKAGKELTAGYIKQLLQKKFSDKNTPERRAEEATYINFVMFLDECEESSLPVSLEEVLIFFTGADREPPLGFPVIPKLEFLHSDGILATASTCSLILRLPTVHDSYPSFRQYMALSFGGHGGFGVV